MKKNIVITIARQYGSGGRTVGKMLAKELGINYYNKELSWKLYFGEDYIYGDDDAGRIYNNYKSFDACVCCIRPFE